MEDAYSLSSGGGNYRSRRDERALTLDANFVRTESIVLSPYVIRTFQGSSYINPFSGENARDGYAFGGLMHVQFDQMLRLNGLKLSRPKSADRAVRH